MAVGSGQQDARAARDEVEEAVSLKGFTHARLSCGCRLTFREGIEGSRVVVVIDRKSPGCAISLHVQDAPLYRPSRSASPVDASGFS